MRVIEASTAEIFINQLKELARAKNSHVQNKRWKLPGAFSSCLGLGRILLPRSQQQGRASTD